MRTPRATVAAALAAVLVAGLAVTAGAAGAATTAVSTNDSVIGATAPGFEYNGTWGLYQTPYLHNGDEHYSTTKGATYHFRFYGTRLTLIGSKGPSYGRSRVEVWRYDTRTVDQYAPSTARQEVLYVSPLLPKGYHVVKVTVLRSKRVASVGHRVAIDRAVTERPAVVTVPTTTSTPTPTPTPTATPTATATATAAPTASPTPTVSAPTGALPSLLMDNAELMALPTTGMPWTSMLTVAEGDLGAPDLANQDNTNAGRTLAAALVYARTGETAYRDDVVAQLRQVPTANMTGARVLSVSRQVAGYAIAADLVGYRDPAFVTFMTNIRTRNIGNHGRWYALTQTSEDTANNWGAWALASRIAASRYVRDTADVARAAKVFHGFTGDRASHVFKVTMDADQDWSCNPLSSWVPINPASCALSGAIVEEISRTAAAFPAIDDVGRTYSWETLGGATLSATLLSQVGYDVYNWNDKALLRAARFLESHGGYTPLYTVNQYIPWAINRAYGVAIGPVSTRSGFGRQFGYTDWLTG